MTVWQFSQTIWPIVGSFYPLWLIWRSLRTGMPVGDPNMNPRRSERPGQFWAMIAFHAVLAIGLLAGGIARVVALLR